MYIVESSFYLKNIDFMAWICHFDIGPTLCFSSIKINDVPENYRYIQWQCRKWQFFLHHNKSFCKGRERQKLLSTFLASAFTSWHKYIPNIINRFNKNKEFDQLDFTILIRPLFSVCFMHVYLVINLHH